MQEPNTRPGACTRRGTLVQHGSVGFSLIEVIVVVALMAGAYVFLLPRTPPGQAAAVASALSQLAGDIRSAYDQAVLTGQPYRMVFVMATGDYWLEDTNRPDIFITTDKLDRDLTEAEEKDEEAAFETRFQEFVDLAGQSIVDPSNDKEIPATSPVVQAKNRLRRPVWHRVSSMEWGPRTLGPHLLIKDMQAEHHGHKQDFAELGPEARAIIYFFPSGYVERAVIHVAFRKDDLVIDDSQEPYTVTTNSLEGTADVEPGYLEVDVHTDPDT